MPKKSQPIELDAGKMTPEQVAALNPAPVKRELTAKTGSGFNKDNGANEKGSGNCAPGQKNVKSSEKSGGNSEIAHGSDANESTNTRARKHKTPVFLKSDLIDYIIDELHERSLTDICVGDDMPTRSAFLKRLAADKELQQRYSFAIEARADKFADEIVQISDDGANDTYVDDHGNVKTDHDVVARSRLRVDARKWAAAKMAPKKYGDRLDVDHGVQEGNPLLSLLTQISGTALPVASNTPDEDED